MSKPRTWLIVDVNNLCWKAFYAMGHLSYGEELTGVLFGVFKDIVDLQIRYQTNHIAFCFDLGDSFRNNICRTYKMKRKQQRKEISEEDQKNIKEIYRQINDLRKVHLPAIGYRNVFAFDHFEADDLIASICKNNIIKPHKGIIVSNDKDLFQCLRDNITIFQSRTGSRYTKAAFREDYGLHPRKWKDIKAIAGCTTDNVPGIPGVGEKTAAKFLRGELPKHHKTFKAIKDCGDIWEQNLAVVELPYLGTPNIELVKDEVTEKNWRKVMRRLGMISLRDQCPLR